MMGRSHDEYMIERFRTDPDYAASLVNDILEDGDDQGELKLILQHIAAAGLKVSLVSVAPEPKPKPRKAVAAKGTKQLPASHVRSRRPAVAIA